MADIKLFSIHGEVHEIKGSAATLEKELQTKIEQNMEIFFGVRFLASEYKTDDGRIDSIGIDENNCAVIFEYKRNISENVINQGLHYLNWLMTHRADFELLVAKKLGLNIANEIDWSMPRVICIAGDFNRYDESALNQMSRNIALIRYKIYEDKWLIFEKIAEKVIGRKEQRELLANEEIVIDKIENTKMSKNKNDYSFEKQFEAADDKLKELYRLIEETVLSFGDDVTIVNLKLYTAFRKVKNFISCVIRTGNRNLLLYLNLDPNTVKLENGFTKDKTNIGHWGTGDLEVTISNKNDIEKALPLLKKAYEEN